LVREYVDPNAVLWKNDSLDEGDPNGLVHLLEMEYINSDWSNVVHVSSFTKIVQDLRSLHQKQLVHGDIRLANMLSTGRLLDFDYVRQSEYPPGLTTISDGSRHKEVVDNILKESVGHLLKMRAHDVYSMGAVMMMFEVTGDESRQMENVGQWNKACLCALDLCADDNALDKVLSILSPCDFYLQLKHSGPHLNGTGTGTGGTP
jgi:hypothetical protein